MKSSYRVAVAACPVKTPSRQWRRPGRFVRREPHSPSNISSWDHLAKQSAREPLGIKVTTGCTSSRLPIRTPSNESRDSLVRVSRPENVCSDSGPITEGYLHIFLKNGVCLKRSVGWASAVALGQCRRDRVAVVIVWIL